MSWRLDITVCQLRHHSHVDADACDMQVRMLEGPSTWQACSAEGAGFWPAHSKPDYIAGRRDRITQVREACLRFMEPNTDPAADAAAEMLSGVAPMRLPCAIDMPSCMPGHLSRHGWRARPALDAPRCERENGWGHRSCYLLAPATVCPPACRKVQACFGWGWHDACRGNALPVPAADTQPQSAELLCTSAVHRCSSECRYRRARPEG